MPQTGCEPLQRRLGWVASAAFDAADVSLRDAAHLGEFNLGKASLDASIPELKPKREAGGEGFPQRSILGGIGSLGLGQVVTELGSHGRPSSARFSDNSSMRLNT